MEIIERDEQSRDGLVPIAYAETGVEAALIRGLLREGGIRSLARQATLGRGTIGSGALTRGSRHIYTRPEDADRARTLLGETMVEDPLEEEIPEPANAAYLAEASGGAPRNYTLLGAYARAWIIALVSLGVVLVVFLLIHGT